MCVESEFSHVRVLLLGASGRIGRRVATELLDRGYEVTGVSRSGTVEDVEDPSFVAVAGDAADPDAVGRLATGHDAVASALGPSEGEDPAVLVDLMDAVIEGMRRASVDRLVWTGGAGGLYVGPDTRLVETDEFPDEWEGLARSAIDAYEVLAEADDLEWTYLAPAALIEPGERTGEYRTAEGELVADEAGDSYISMADFAVALADVLDSDEAVHTYLGTGY
jgi:putative NADH-flavin reductase